MQKVVVTGSCGFIGHHLVRELRDRDYYVIGIDNLTTGSKEYANLANVFCHKDIRKLTKKDFQGVK